MRIFGISRDIVWRILKITSFTLTECLFIKHYNDFWQELAFYNWISQQHDFHLKILFSDECIFKSDGFVNTWNFRYWVQINPHWLKEIHHQIVWKVNVWFGIVSEIVGPVLFDENLNDDRYSALIVTDLPVLLENLPLQLRLNMHVRCIHRDLLVRH